MNIKNRVKPTWDSIKSRELPKWYDDTKVGIFIHWGPYSVPAYAPVTVELGDIPVDEGWFCNNPYAEWYYNSLNVGQGPTYDHHIKTYGENFEYENFTHMWKAEKFDSDYWADLFKRAGAGYVVLTTKHHDGFCLWPSKHTDYNTFERGPMRDLMGELTQSVKKAGLKMGAYYSGLIDWRYADDPIFEESDLYDTASPLAEYSDYAYKQVTELIDKYEPSVLWNDIGWPVKGTEDLKYLFAHYYNTVEDGVVADRWNDTWCDFQTQEYKQGEITEGKKWEMTRGVGLSFGYNQEEEEDDILSPRQLISLLVRSVANGGNLLINIGPRADGTIPKEQEDLLLQMGKWLEVNGEAIYSTRCHTRTEEKTKNEESIYFTTKDNNLYIMIDDIKDESVTILVPEIYEVADKIMALDSAINAEFTNTKQGLEIKLKGLVKDTVAVAFMIPNHIK